MVLGLVLMAMTLGACGSSIPGSARSGSGQQPPIDPNLYIQTNNAYKHYPPATKEQAAAGAPVAAAISWILPAIAAAPPITESSVRSALQSVTSSTNPHGEIEVSAHAASGDGIGFGVFVPVGKSGACVHGWISTRDSNVAVDGISPDGGCLALLGA